MKCNQTHQRNHNQLPTPVKKLHIGHSEKIGELIFVVLMNLQHSILPFLSKNSAKFFFEGRSSLRCTTGSQPISNLVLFHFFAAERSSCNGSVMRLVLVSTMKEKERAVLCQFVWMIDAGVLMGKMTSV